MSINIGYSIRDSLANFRRNWVMSLGAVVTIFLSLLIIGVVLVGGSMVDTVVKSVESKVSIQIFLSDAAKQEDVDSLQKWLEANPEVKSVGYTSKEQALANFKKTVDDSKDIVEGLGNQNPLPASLDVEMNDPRTVQSTADSILKNPSFLKVCDNPETPASSLKYGQDIVRKLFTATKYIRIVGVLLVGMLSLVALIFINNTIRLAIYARRKEIGIMRLVGASNGFIRAPFLVEGAFQALIGAILAILTIFAITSLLLPSLATSISWLPLGVSNAMEIKIFVILLVSGIFIGLLGSALAMRRYLKV